MAAERNAGEMAGHLVLHKVKTVVTTRCPTPGLLSYNKMAYQYAGNSTASLLAAVATKQLLNSACSSITMQSANYQPVVPVPTTKGKLQPHAD